MQKIQNNLLIKNYQQHTKKYVFFNSSLLLNHNNPFPYQQSNVDQNLGKSKLVKNQLLVIIYYPIIVESEQQTQQVCHQFKKYLDQSSQLTNLQSELVLCTTLPNPQQLQTNLKTKIFNQQILKIYQTQNNGIFQLQQLIKLYHNPDLKINAKIKDYIIECPQTLIDQSIASKFFVKMLDNKQNNNNFNIGLIKILEQEQQNANNQLKYYDIILQYVFSKKYQDQFNQILKIQEIKILTNPLSTINKYSTKEAIINKWYNKFQCPQLLRHFIQDVAFFIYHNQLTYITQQQICKIFLNQQFNEQMKKDCLLVSSNNNYQFISQSLLQFHVVKYIIRKVKEMNYDYLPYEITRSYPICRLIQQWLLCNIIQYKTMMKIVQRSKTDKQIQKSAAAAITILNIGRVLFSYLDLSAISIPYANLTGAYFYKSNIQNANLQNVILDKAYLVDTKLNRSDLRGVKFQRKTIATNYNVVSFDISRSGRYLIVCGGNKQKHNITIYEYKTMKTIQQWQVSSILKIQFSVKEKIIVSTHSNGQIKIWHLENGNIFGIVLSQNHQTSTILFSPDGNTITSCSLDNKTIKIWDSENGINLKTINVFSKVYSISYSPDGKQIASSSQKLQIEIYDIETCKVIKKLIGHDRPVIKVSYSPDGKNIMSYGYSRKIIIWDINTSSKFREIYQNTDIKSICFSPDGAKLAVSGYDHIIKVWNIYQEKKLKAQVLQGHENHILSLSFSPTGKQIISCGYDYKISLWDLNTFDFSELVIPKNRQEINLDDYKLTLIGRSQVRSFIKIKNTECNDIIGEYSIVQQLHRMK